jgi:alpha-N-acetylglucosaminidase
MKKIRTLLLTLALLVSAAALADGNAALQMQKMVRRLFPDRAQSFVFRQVSSATDCFTLRSEGTKIVISGNDANSMAVGLNYYLKNYCLTTVSWFAADPVELPRVLPMVKTAVSVKAKVPMRFFLNYCTYGYTMPWWTWKDWEHFIDWMALNGINMPLAITGQEAIWYNVWRQFGLTDEEIRSYFTGPAHLPWHRMCNVDGWQSPLPMSWLNSQKELQKLIVARERELNMKPILPAFAGHIPAALKRVFPSLKTSEVSQWGGFGTKYRCTFLSPMDSLYTAIQKAYMTEQTKLYGTDHIYGVDPFNEVDPPSWREDSLAMMSSRIYQSMRAVDKDARWLQMTWLFYYAAKNWTAPRVKAMVRGVPQDKMILLDYFCENTEIWQRTESYFGQPFIWCYLGNFGGNTMVCGPLQKISSRLSNTFAKAGSNFQGIGATLEGLDVNQFAYEFVLDKAWDLPQTDAQWLDNLACRRLGKQPAAGTPRYAAAEKAWRLLCDKVLSLTSSSFQGTKIEWRPTLSVHAWQEKKMNPQSELDDFCEVWREMLSLAGKTNSDTYTFDVVNIGRQCLGDYFGLLNKKFADAYRTGNIDSLKLIGSRMKDILRDVDALTACHSTFSLKQWIDKARAMGKDAAEKDYYERNARTIVTVWGDSHQLTDYARRGWAGLISNYYAPRWTKFIDEVTAAAVSHRTFDEKAFNDECYAFERRFIEPSTVISYPPKGNGVVLAKKLYQKYFAR